MEIRQLKAFIEIARTGNLTEAAAQLNASQPAISAQIKALEEEVGFALFHRNAKGMSMTEKGSKLLINAVRILDSIDEFHYTADALHENSIDTIQIGLNTDNEVLRIKQMVSRITDSMPQLELHFIDLKSEDFTQALEHSKIDAGFFYGKIVHPSVSAVKLHSFKMVVVYPQSWDVNDDELSLEFFAKHPWIWSTKGCPFYKQSIDFFRKKGIDLQKIMYVDDESLIGKLVQEEVGCSLLAEPIAEQFAEKSMLKIWRGVDLSIDLCFGCPKEKKNDPALLKICAILNEIWETFNPAEVDLEAGQRGQVACPRRKGQFLRRNPPKTMNF
ncbi:HTH-type transcriptional regulator HdfR [Sporomusa rhizae]|uniref:LysR family transcriptional regulator n=1 Tax=Sporomusa rhizae TaxID=357999 RepID=UPI00352A7C14